MEFASRNKRMLAFFIDRIYTFGIAIISMYFTNYFDMVTKLIEYGKNQDMFNTYKYAFLLPVIGYSWILLYYFIFFVIIQYFTKFTLGKYICKIQLYEYDKDSDNEPKLPSFMYLIKRYLLLYLFGVGAMGYLYIFSKSKEAAYDTNLESFVFDIKNK